jgi:uncharacterized protein (UPF0261 family)
MRQFGKFLMAALATRQNVGAVIGLGGGHSAAVHAPGDQR